MIVIVCGGRKFTNGTYLFDQMDRLHAEYHFTRVVEGGQRTFDRKTRKPIGGADFFAHEWAVLRGVLIHTEYARWRDLDAPGARIMTNGAGRRYDANAGKHRNQKMFDDWQPGLVVGFSPSGSGTAHMLGIAKAAGVDVVELRAP